MIDDDIEKAFDVDVVLAKYKEDYGIDKRDPFYGEYMPMFLAEDIEQKIPSHVTNDGRIFVGTAYVEPFTLRMFRGI